MPSVKVAIPSLRRRVGIGQLRRWLDAVVPGLRSSHPMHAELSQIRGSLTLLSALESARRQVAAFYKSWYDAIAVAPPAERSITLFKDLSSAYALGKSLPIFPDEGTARRPESVAEPLMLSCL